MKFHETSGGGQDFDKPMTAIDISQFETLDEAEIPLSPLISKESIDGIAANIDNGNYSLMNYQEVVALKVEQNERDMETKIQIGIRHKGCDDPQPETAAEATVKDGVLHINRLPLPNNPEQAVEDWGYKPLVSTNLLQAFTEIARESGCREARIADPSVHPQTEELCQKIEQETRLDNRVMRFINMLDISQIDNGPRQQAERSIAAIYGAAEHMGYKFNEDEDGPAWVRTLNNASINHSGPNPEFNL